MYDAIVIGVSKGGLQALKTVLGVLPVDFPTPVIIVQHQGEAELGTLATLLNKDLAIELKEADLNENIVGGHVYLSCPGYHLLVEQDKTLALSTDPPLNYSRPSIDVLFESAAEVYQDKLIGIILTGASADGSLGLATIKQYGGLALVQDPSTAEAARMPQAAIEAATIDHVLSLHDIGKFILRICYDNQ